MHIPHKIIGLGALIATFVISAQAAVVNLPVDGNEASFASRSAPATGAAFAELSGSSRALPLALADGSASGLLMPAGSFQRPPSTVAEAADAPTAVVPEPSTYATLLAGLALLTLVMNRRRD